MYPDSICLGSLKWSNFVINKEKYQQCLQEYSHTEDGYIHTVWAIVYDKQDRIYLHHNAQKNEFFLPRWKVEIGETFEQAVMREMKEELNIDVKKCVYLSSIKYIIGWVYWCFHTFVVEEYEGIPINNMSDEYDQYRAKKIQSDNTLGFGIVINGTITEDEEDIMHTFLDLYHVWVIASQIDKKLFLSASYAEYDESLIDISKHYYLWFDINKKEYKIQFYC